MTLYKIEIHETGKPGLIKETYFCHRVSLKEARKEAISLISGTGLSFIITEL